MNAIMRAIQNDEERLYFEDVALLPGIKVMSMGVPTLRTSPLFLFSRLAAALRLALYFRRLINRFSWGFSWGLAADK